jgi:hypothetical protein
VGGERRGVALIVRKPRTSCFSAAFSALPSGKRRYVADAVELAREVHFRFQRAAGLPLHLRVNRSGGLDIRFPHHGNP